MEKTGFDSEDSIKGDRDCTYGHDSRYSGEEPPAIGSLQQKRKATMASTRFPSLVGLLLLLLSAINLASGKAVKPGKNNEEPSENCPPQSGTQEDFPPKSLTFQVHIGRPQPASEVPQDIRNRSASPWDYSIHEDHNRFPHVISKATCRHAFCLDSKGKPNIALNSVPIQQEIMVLRRKLVGCQQTFWLEKEVINVGCTCVMSRTYANRSA
ncbi:interleukininterleukin-17F-like [Podarcis lilfordi]|uniref:Interleukininterleukin-17F-like n=1 Tax=Podarcis lilfordi TaxID=74358 RepID=A0AA35K2G6_9SAUR|nr:interleukininterleukin-17F-like [Podarcis lilfordi]